MLASHALGAKEYRSDSDNESSPLHTRRSGARVPTPPPPTTIVGTGTQGLGPKCEKDLHRINNMCFNEWKRKKRVQPPEKPKLLSPKESFEETKRILQEKKAIVMNMTEKKGHTNKEETKALKAELDMHKAEQEKVLREWVAEERERRKEKKHHVLQAHSQQKRRSSQVDRAKMTEHRLLWQQQKEEEASYAAEVFAIHKDIRKATKQQAELSRKLHSEQQYQEVVSIRKSLSQRRNMIRKEKERDTEARQKDIQKMREDEKLAKERITTTHEMRLNQIKEMEKQRSVEVKKQIAQNKESYTRVVVDTAKAVKDQENKAHESKQTCQQKKKQNWKDCLAVQRRYKEIREMNVEEDVKWSKTVVADAKAKRGNSPRTRSAS